MSTMNWPETTDFFSFYGLVPVYELDESGLKKIFLEKARQFHPDFFGDDITAQSKAIAITAFNNKAYKTLSRPAERIRYLIELNNVGEVDNMLPQDFLMEMMDLNEQIDEFGFAENKEELKQKIESEISGNMQHLMDSLINLVNGKQWVQAHSELLKLNYLERLRERLSSDIG